MHGLDVTAAVAHASREFLLVLTHSYLVYACVFYRHRESCYRRTVLLYILRIYLLVNDIKHTQPGVRTLVLTNRPAYHNQRNPPTSSRAISHLSDPTTPSSALSASSPLRAAAVGTVVVADERPGRDA